MADFPPPEAFSLWLALSHGAFTPPRGLLILLFFLPEPALLVHPRPSSSPASPPAAGSVAGLLAKAPRKEPVGCSKGGAFPGGCQPTPGHTLTPADSSGCALWALTVAPNPASGPSPPEATPKGPFRGASPASAASLGAPCGCSAQGL